MTASISELFDAAD